MKKALITGANKSIGFEAARLLLQNGYYVYLGSRDLENGAQAVAQLHAEGLTQVEPIQLDVADAELIATRELRIAGIPFEALLQYCVTVRAAEAR